MWDRSSVEYEKSAALLDRDERRAHKFTSNRLSGEGGSKLVVGDREQGGPDASGSLTTSSMFNGPPFQHRPDDVNSTSMGDCTGSSR